MKPVRATLRLVRPLAPIFVVLVSYVVLAASPPAWAQRYQVRIYSDEDGLPSADVKDLVQDSTGRMWFATRSGIAVYDGLDWTAFSSAQGLPRPAQCALAVDPRGGLWALECARSIRVSRYQAGAWESLPETGEDAADPPSLIAVALDGDRAVVAVAGASEIRLWSGAEWRRMPATAITVNRLLAHGAGFYVATGRGLAFLSASPEAAEDALATAWFDERVRPQVPDPAVRGLAVEGLESGAPRLWMVGGDWIGHAEEDRFTLFSTGIAGLAPGASDPVDVEPDRRGGLFFGNQHGLVHVDRDGRPETLGIHSGLAADGAAALLLDREENLWVASIRGVTKIESFRLATYDREHGLLEDEVTAVLERRDGTIVLGHNTGLTILEDSGPRTVRLIEPDAEDAPRIRVLDLAEDVAGDLWIAAGALGLLRMRKTGGPERIAGEEIAAASSVLPDANGSLWVSHPGGLARWRGRRPEPVEGVPCRGIRRLFGGPDGELYLASATDGVCALSRDGRWSRWRSSEPGGDNVFAVLAEPGGGHWVGTAAGLFRHPPGSAVLERGSLGERTVERPVYFLMTDRGDRLWIGTDDGVFRWSAGTSEHFTVADGLAGRETNRAGGLVDSRGRVWIGTDRGVSVYREELDRRRQPPAPELTLLETALGRYPLGAPVTLAPGETEVAFHYRALSFTDEKRLRYRCWLEGHEPEPAKTEFEPSPLLLARYSNLAAGTYRFHLQVETAEGRRSEVVSSAPIVVERPVWARPWFLAVAALLAGWLIFLVHCFFAGRRYAGRLQHEVRLRTKELETSESRYRQLVEGMNDGLAIADADGIVLYVNDRFCDMFGRARDEVLGQPSRTFFDQANWEIVSEQIRRRRAGAAEPYEVEWSLPGGGSVTTLVSPTPLFDDEGRFRGSFATFTDITGQKEAEAPVHGLQEMVDDILDFSRVGGDGPALHAEELSIRHLLDEVGQVFKPRAAAKGLTLSSDVAGGVPDRLIGDPPRLRQVLLILVDNAVKFTSRGEIAVEVSAVSRDETGLVLRFAVRDTGIGIPRQARTELFEPFTRAASSASRPFGRTGLGLATAKRLVEVMGGEIGLESRPDVGSTFHFTARFRLAEGESAPVPGGAAPLSVRILVAEDNLVNSLVAMRQLAVLGFEADAVETGRQALKALEAKRYDLVLMDCQMPELDGYEATRRIRRRESGPHRLPVVGVTSPVFAGERERCLEAGMDDYLAKPFSTEDLAAVLERWLPGRGRERGGGD